MSGLFQGCARYCLAPQCSVGQIAKCNFRRAVTTLRAFCIPREGRSLRSEGLPAVAAACSTRRRCAGTNRHVPELACCVSLAAVDLTIENNSGAQTIFNQNHYEVPNFLNFRTAKPQLS